VIPYARPKRGRTSSLLDKALTPASQITFSIRFDKKKVGRIQSSLRELPRIFAQVTDQQPQLPRHVCAMSAEEVRLSRKVRSDAGHGMYDAITDTIKVNPHMSADNILLNVIHEMIHADLPWLLEYEVDQLSEKIFRRVRPTGDGGPRPEAVGLDAAQIAQHLWMGSKPEIGRAVGEAGFDLLVLCAEEYQPPYWEYPGVEVIHAPFDDNDIGPLPTEKEIARSAARSVADAIRSAREVLVTCYAGINRSAYVAGMALVEIGYDPLRAIKLIQSRRNKTLTNPWFVDLIAGSG